MNKKQVGHPEHTDKTESSEDGYVVEFCKNEMMIIGLEYASRYHDNYVIY